MDFKLTKTQMLQQELFRKFAETEVKPIAKHYHESIFLIHLHLTH